MDLVLAGGFVIDGTGGPAYLADVGLGGGRIVAVGDLSAADVSRRIDVSGRVVCPGFIDMHAHSDLSLVGGQIAVDHGVVTSARAGKVLRRP